MQRPAVVQSLSDIWLFATPRTTVYQVPCPSLSPETYSDSYALSRWCYLRFISLSRWCYLTTSSSATPCSFCFQSFPARGLDTVHWNVQSWPLRVLATPGQYVAKLLPSQSLSFQQNILFLWFSMKFFPYKQVAILMLKYNSDELLFLQQEFK